MLVHLVRIKINKNKTKCSASTVRVKPLQIINNDIPHYASIHYVLRYQNQIFYSLHFVEVCDEFAKTGVVRTVWNCLTA